ncbi:sugar isomerase, partial [bacterium]|nr:sugar isomerase [bacterium]
TVVFVRHKSGPTYYGYECLGVRHFPVPSIELWSRNSADNHGEVTLDDVVVDDYDDVLWRLRSLYGLHSFVGQRVVALGGPMGKWDGKAPDVARQRYKLDIVDVSYDDLAARLTALAADQKFQQQCAAWTDRCLAVPGTRLETKKEFVQRAFALYAVFRQWLREHEAPAITFNQCMGTILSVSNTTACMPLSWLNDEGFIAFCESDFVVVPAGILLHYISGKPVFMHNSTFPHKAIVTCAHCTAPRRMDGKHYEPVRIMTHYESDFGAAPKVELPIGQQVCAISPEYSTARWVGIKAVVRDNPCFAICRSQQDVEIQGNWRRLIPEARDSHWMMVYGDYLREIGYAAHKIGLTWDNISDVEV